MRRTLAIALLIAAGPLALAGCRADEDTEPAAVAASESSPAAELSPAELGVIGAELRAEPSRADEILAARGLDWERYETAVRAVAADVEASREYERALLEGEDVEADPGDSGP